MTLHLVELKGFNYDMRAKVTNLMCLAFPAQQTNYTKIVESTRSACHGIQTRYFAAFSDDELVGFNAFIPAAFRRGGLRSVAYQSCWSATHPAHQGRGIWVKLMLFARQSLEEDGLFIFGIPNPNSHPIMIKKLGYREVPVLTTLIPNTTIAFPYWIEDGTRNFEAIGFYPDERAVAESKFTTPGLSRKEAGSSFVWGKVEKDCWKRLPARFLRIGGIELRNADLGHVLQGMSSASFIQVTISSTHEMCPLFKKLKLLSGVRPFVVLDLQASPSDPLNIFMGITDVF